MIFWQILAESINFRQFELVKIVRVKGCVCCVCMHTCVHVFIICFVVRKTSHLNTGNKTFTSVFAHNTDRQTHTYTYAYNSNFFLISHSAAKSKYFVMLAQFSRIPVIGYPLYVLTNKIYTCLILFQNDETINKCVPAFKIDLLIK